MMYTAPFDGLTELAGGTTMRRIAAAGSALR